MTSRGRWIRHLCLLGMRRRMQIGATVFVQELGSRRSRYRAALCFPPRRSLETRIGPASLATTLWLCAHLTVCSLRQTYTSSNNRHPLQLETAAALEFPCLWCVGSSLGPCIARATTAAALFYPCAFSFDQGLTLAEHQSTWKGGYRIRLPDSGLKKRACTQVVLPLPDHVQSSCSLS